MEQQLFDWDGWDQQDTACFTFYKPVLKIQIGHFKPGTKFDFANVDYEKGELALYVSEQEKHTFKLTLGVVVES